MGALSLNKDRVIFASYGSCLRTSPHVYKSLVKGQILLFMSLGTKQGGGGLFGSLPIIDKNEFYC